MKFISCIATVIFFYTYTFSQTTPTTEKKLLAPEILPGNGLAQHDFFYAGEARSRKMYIVKKGKIVWSYDDSLSKGEISDAVLMKNGNLFIAYQFGVSLIDKYKKVLWHYDVPKGHEVHTGQPIGKKHVVFIQNGDTAKVMVVNIETRKTVKEFAIPVANPSKVHGQFRHARLTSKGTLMVAHMDMGKVCTYDFNGNQLTLLDVPGVWGVQPLDNGNILTAGKGSVKEITPKGDTVWNLKMTDVPEYSMTSLQTAIKRPNGNIVFNSWFNQWWGAKVDMTNLPVQVLEITPDKKVVWALRAWNAPNLGPATIIQFLGEKNGTDKVHFGDIK